MIEFIQNFFLETVGKELCVFFCSMLPIIELRGAIPLGAALGLEWWATYILAVLGNILPVPFILLFIKKIITWMSSCRITLFNKTANFLVRKAEKNRDRIEKYSFWGVCIFVAIPLPVTGLFGVMIAGVIMTLASYGVVAAFQIFA